MTRAWNITGMPPTFQEKTAEGNTVETLRKKQRLVISAADKILTTFGPDKGYVFEPDNGLIIASLSVVAHDMVSLAWLLENRRSIPESQKDDFLDTSTVAPRFANHIVTSWLGGWGPAIASETLTKNELKTIWDDRVITRACEVFGGVPGITLEPVNSALSRTPEAAPGRDDNPPGLTSNINLLSAAPGMCQGR